jgi:hypothetical protein
MKSISFVSAFVALTLSQPVAANNQAGIAAGDRLISGSVLLSNLSGSGILEIQGGFERVLGSGNSSIGLGFLLAGSSNVSTFALAPSYNYWFNPSAPVSGYVGGGLLLLDGIALFNASGGGIFWITETAGIRPEAGLLFGTNGGGFILNTSALLTIKI